MAHERALKFLVLDSTELTADWLLRNPSMQLVAELRGLRLAIPAPVVLEAHANHARATEENSRILGRALRDRQRLGFPVQETRDRYRPYREELQDALDELDAIVLPWPSVSHEEVTRRATLRIPPFDNKGGGYRDTLVWMSAADLASRGHTVYLATRDKAFRDDGKEALAAALNDEISGYPGTVQLVTNLSTWLIDQVTDATGKAPQHDRFETMLRQAEDYLNGWQFEDAWVHPREAALPDAAGEWMIEYVVASGAYQEPQIRQLIGGGYFVEYSLEVEAQLEAEVPESLARHYGWPYDRQAGPALVRAHTQADLIVRIGALYNEHGTGLEIEYVRYEPARTSPAPGSGPAPFPPPLP